MNTQTITCHKPRLRSRYHRDVAVVIVRQFVRKRQGLHQVGLLTSVNGELVSTSRDELNSGAYDANSLAMTIPFRPSSVVEARRMMPLPLQQDPS